MILQIYNKFRHKNSESWLDYRQKKEIFLFVKGTNPFWDSPKVLQCVPGAQFQEKGSRKMKLITHFSLVPRLRSSGVIIAHPQPLIT